MQSILLNLLLPIDNTLKFKLEVFKLEDRYSPILGSESFLSFYAVSV